MRFACEYNQVTRPQLDRLNAQKYRPLKVPSQRAIEEAFDLDNGKQEDPH